MWALVHAHQAMPIDAIFKPSEAPIAETLTSSKLTDIAATAIKLQDHPLGICHRAVWQIFVAATMHNKVRTWFMADEDLNDILCRSRTCPQQQTVCVTTIVSRQMP
jgi:hypothetical protein